MNREHFILFYFEFVARTDADGGFKNRNWIDSTKVLLWRWEGTDLFMRARTKNSEQEPLKAESDNDGVAEIGNYNSGNSEMQVGWVFKQSLIYAVQTMTVCLRQEFNDDLYVSMSVIPFKFTLIAQPPVWKRYFSVQNHQILNVSKFLNLLPKKIDVCYGMTS